MRALYLCGVLRSLQFILQGRGRAVKLRRLGLRTLLDVGQLRLQFRRRGSGLLGQLRLGRQRLAQLRELRGGRTLFRALSLTGLGQSRFKILDAGRTVLPGLFELRLPLRGLLRQFALFVRQHRAQTGQLRVRLGVLLSELLGLHFLSTLQLGTQRLKLRAGCLLSGLQRAAQLCQRGLMFGVEALLLFGSLRLLRLEPSQFRSQRVGALFGGAGSRELRVQLGQLLLQGSAFRLLCLAGLGQCLGLCLMQARDILLQPLTGGLLFDGPLLGGIKLAL